MPFSSKPILLVALVAVAGCEPPVELVETEGGWTQGELGRTRWHFNDGLCPNDRRCDLGVPLALGASIVLQIRGAEDVTLAPTVTGALTLIEATQFEESGNWHVTVSASSAGAGAIVFSEGAAVFDRASIVVRRATRLDCGVWTSSNAVRWDMEELEASTELDVPFVEEGAREPQLVCRAADSGGPLLSVDAITWEIIEGADVLTLREYGFGGPPVSGARIHYVTPGPGTARVRATLGDVTQDLTFTVACPAAGCE